jgi:DNA-binding NarL/FixJ family response regulator
VIAASSISGAGSVKRPRLLLADDHAGMLALTAAVLADECFVVGAVGNGCELLAEADRPDPDGIVLDVTTPRLDCIEAARQLKRARRRAKLVFLTLHEYPDYVHTALHAGGTAYVVEACLASGLITAIHEALVEHSFVSPMICLEENP